MHSMIIPDLYIEDQSSAVQHRKIDKRRNSDYQVDDRMTNHT